MKAIVLVLALVFCFAVVAEPIWENIDVNNFDKLATVLTKAAKEPLKKALRKKEIVPGSFHIDRLVSLQRAVEGDLTTYDVVVKISDNNNPKINGPIHSVLEYDGKTKKYDLISYEIGLPKPQ